MTYSELSNLIEAKPITITRAALLNHDPISGFRQHRGLYPVYEPILKQVPVFGARWLMNHTTEVMYYIDGVYIWSPQRLDLLTGDWNEIETVVF